MKIGQTEIDPETLPYVIAEIGNNHQGDIWKALALIDAAADAGANAVKFQRRTIDKCYTKEQLKAPYDNPNSFGKTYGEHRKKLELTLNELQQCATEAKSKGVDFLCTAFDTQALEDIADLVPAFKVASASIGNGQLISKIYEANKPVILSTGGATELELRVATALLDGRDYALLQCTALYPCPAKKINLRGIQGLRDRFHCIVGYSGHDTGIAIPLAAYVMGARIIEKHFTLNRAAKGTDHAMSLEPQGLRTLVENIRKVHSAMGSHGLVVYGEERPALEKMGKSYG
jgi:sialic acid synthase